MSTDDEGIQDEVRTGEQSLRKAEKEVQEEMRAKRGPSREVEIRYGDIGEEPVEDEPVDQTGAGDMPGGPEKGGELPLELRRKLEKEAKEKARRLLEIERGFNVGYGAMSPPPEEQEPDD